MSKLTNRFLNMNIGSPNSSSTKSSKSTNSPTTNSQIKNNSPKKNKSPKKFVRPLSRNQQVTRKNNNMFMHTSKRKFNTIKRELSKHRTASNKHLREISEYLNTLNRYYNHKLIQKMITQKGKLSKSKSVVNKPYINFSVYSSAIDKHSLAIKDIYRDYVNDIKKFKQNIQNIHNSFRQKVLTSNPRFWNIANKARVQRNLFQQFEEAKKSGIPVNKINYTITPF